jgi:hypothetical protein
MSRITFTETMTIQFGDADLEIDVQISGTFYPAVRGYAYGSQMEPPEPAFFEAASIEWRMHKAMPWEPMPAALVDALGDAIDAAGCEAWQHECEAAAEARAEAQREREWFGPEAAE